uniref:Protein kinase domain-containing protein n=1 Tax=Physcomitrium patens TaxID=3218 RepID=A0A7I4AUX3_PHYPA
MDVRLGIEKYPLVHQPCFLAALFVLLCTPSICDGLFTWQTYKSQQLDGLQALLKAWKSTPKIESNLAGWNESQKYPCNQDVTEDIAPNWRGVQCLQYINCFYTNKENTTRDCSTYIIGLTLQNASIVGSLPRDIGYISTLTTLELTGNPQLTGPLPVTLNETSLYVLDLHDNAFEGEFPFFGDEYESLLTLDLSGNKFNGSFPYLQIKNMVFLQILNIARNDFKGPIPEPALENITQLVELDLSSNALNGTAPTLKTIKNLQVLDLSSNMFTGTLPDLTTMHSLRSVNLSRNAFTGAVLLSSFFNRTENNSLSVLDLSFNQLTTDPNFWNISELGSLQELYLDNNLINGTLNISQLHALGLLRTKITNSSSSTNSTSSVLRVLSLMNNNISKVIYDVNDIANTATVIKLQENPFCNFSDPNDGTRCFCEQFCSISGSTEDSKRKIVIIAVVVSVTSLLILLVSLAALLYRNTKYKRYLQLQVQQRFEEFEVKPTIFHYSELRTATRDFNADLKLGEGAFGAVYKGTLPNGNTMAIKQLFAKTSKASSNKNLLNWHVRLKICLGVARGLHYLHALAHPKIIHRDIKASNILITKYYEAKIADFGLALFFPDEQSYILTKHVAGTKGYLAPEYASLGQLSDKVDVFSFGVLCLEIISGRRNIDEKYPLDKVYLTRWIWDLYRQDKLMDLVDKTMTLKDEEKMEVHRAINIALLCIQNEAEQRPSMEQVVAMLQGQGESEIVVLKPRSEEKLMENIKLVVEGKSSLGTIKEEDELSFLSSSRQSRKYLRDDYSTGVVLELSEIRLR